MAAVLHYIYDPLCGWCYAAEPLVAAAAGVCSLQLHAGGLFQDTRLTAEQRDHIRFADARIGELSGQPFGPAYLDGLLLDPATVYDSRPPIGAILAAGALAPGGDRVMLNAIQRAHYVRGLPVVAPEVLAGLARDIGLDGASFSEALHDASLRAAAHIAGTRSLMSRVAAQGFPTFVLEQGDGMQVLRHEPCYGRPDAFAAELSRRLMD